MGASRHALGLPTILCGWPRGLLVPTREMIRVRDEGQAVGKTLAALSRLGVQAPRSTVLPGVGSSAVLQVQLAHALRADQVALVTKRLLTLRYVERVETALLERDEDEPEPRAGALVRDVDVTDIVEARGNPEGEKQGL